MQKSLWILAAGVVVTVALASILWAMRPPAWLDELQAGMTYEELQQVMVEQSCDFVGAYHVRTSTWFKDGYVVTVSYDIDGRSSAPSVASFSGSETMLSRVRRLLGL